MHNQKFVKMGIFIGVVIVAFGLYFYTQTTNEPLSSGTGSSYLYDDGYASFGGDFYTYVNNNTAGAAIAARATAQNVESLYTMIGKIASIFTICFGGATICLFGSFLEPKIVASSSVVTIQQTDTPLNKQPIEDNQFEIVSTIDSEEEKTENIK